MNYRDLLVRFYARDRGALFSRMHPDFVCHTPGRSQIAGSHRGLQGMLDHVARMQRLTNQSFRPHARGAFMSDGEWGTVPVHLRAERDGRVLDMAAFGVWRFHEGTVIEHWETPVDIAKFDEFWG
ncbi:hypothetical protein BH09PSE5_BH09PSE5_26350 [soil metagenome]